MITFPKSTLNYRN